METFILPRTGAAPLRFEGEVLAETSTRRMSGQERNRWYEVTLYRTGGGKYIMAIGYRTQWQGESGTDRAIIWEGPSDVRDALADFDPLADVVGYPDGDAYRAKQDRLERGIRMDWESAIRDLFAGTGDEFAETIS